MPKKKEQLFKCPVCGKSFEMFNMWPHWQEMEDEAHRKLENEIETAANNAYFEEEASFVFEHCETDNS